MRSGDRGSSRSPVTRFIWGAALFAALIAATAPGVARPAFFWGTTENTFISLEHLTLEASAFGASEGETSGKRVTTAAQYDFDHTNGWVLGVGHEYSDLDIEETVAPPPETNGHLHTVHVATQWQTALRGGTFRVAVAPALSVSSNALKNPDALGSDSLQFWGSALYARDLGNTRLIAGAAHDYRFGEGRVYPVAGLEWTGYALSLRAVFPDFRLAWQITTGWNLEAEVAPDGNEWQAFNKALTQANTFRREGWQGHVGLSYRFQNGFEVSALAGRHWQQRWRFVRQDNSAADLDSEDRNFVGLRLAWRPP